MRVARRSTKATSCSHSTMATSWSRRHGLEHDGHLVGLALVEARRRLVEEQQARLADEGTAELDHPAPAQAQGLGRPVGIVDQAELLEHGVAPRPLVGAGARPPREVAEHPAPQALRPIGDHQVVADGEPGEQLDALEGAGQPQPGAAELRHAGQVVTVEVDLTPVGGLDAREAVEQRRLAGAVGADERDQLAGLDRHADLDERGDALVALPDVDGREQGARRRGGWGGGRHGARAGGHASTSTGGARSGGGFPGGGSGLSVSVAGRRLKRLMMRPATTEPCASMMPSGCLA